MNTQAFTPHNLFSERIKAVPTSFIREILKVTAQPEIISFAGGLPNPAFFPVEAIQRATDEVLSHHGKNVLQYSTTEGYAPLREWIAERYRTQQGLTFSPDEILITNGSQQGIDLLGKTFVNPGDVVAIEKPGYLGSIQSLSMYQPRFEAVQLNDDGVDVEELEALYDRETARGNGVKMFSAIPNFQNPTGLSYTERTRERLAEALVGRNTIVVEDDPYGELRFLGTRPRSLRHYFGEQAVLLGSFSKTVAPGLRLGWIAAKKDILDKLVIAKQASDLHSNFFAQRVMMQYLSTNNLDAHIVGITAAYKSQRDTMVQAIDQYFPETAVSTKPEGGMFLWVTLPASFSTTTFFNIAIQHKVAFVPGKPFFADGSGDNTMRLNFSCSDSATITEGIKRLGQLMEEHIALAV